MEHVLPLLSPRVLPFNVDGINPRFTLYVALALTSIREAYPELDLNAYLTEEGIRILDEAASTCLADINDLGEFNDLILGHLIARPLRTIPEFKEKIRALAGSPVTDISGPLLLMQGLLDTDVPTTISNVLTAPALRANGTNVQVVIHPGDTHLTLIEHAGADTLDFLSRNLLPVDRPAP